MNIQIIWADNEDCILQTRVFDPHSEEWHYFEMRSLFDLIQSVEGCAYISMALVTDQPS